MTRVGAREIRTKETSVSRDFGTRSGGAKINGEIGNMKLCCSYNCAHSILDLQTRFHVYLI